MTPDNKIKAPSFFYRLLFPIWFLFWFIHALLHAFKYKEWRYIFQRLGLYPTPKRNTIWIHASSVGEVNLIKPLCEQLMAQGHSITISTFTATGFQRAQSLFLGQAQIMILPMDCWPISYLFAIRLKAKCALIAETELWPETLYQIAKTKTPLIQINARLSGKSLNTSQFVKSLLIQTLSYFNVHLTRYDNDLDNFISMGVNSDKIQVMGNLKYAQTHSIKSYSDIIQLPYILLASTHHNEEEQLSSLLLDETLKAPLIVIAPRHPARLNSILKSLINQGIDKKRISIRSENQLINSDTKIYIADTFGEMNSLFQHALIVIMGGSFVDVGGHNVLEPAALGACIITGPSDGNIKQDLIDLKQQNALIQVKDLEPLKTKINELLNDAEKRSTLGTNAGQFVQNSQQVLERYLIEINQLMSTITYDDKPK